MTILLNLKREVGIDIKRNGISTRFNPYFGKQHSKDYIMMQNRQLILVEVLAICFLTFMSIPTSLFKCKYYYYCYT